MAKQCPKCHHENPDDTIYCGKCAAPLQPSKDIGVTKTIETPVEKYTRGTTLANRYEIIEELGKGGMGTVYRVDDTKIGQDIALKLIKPEIASDKKTIERFRNELKTTRMISHRNVCRMFDLGDAEGTHFITMEYIPGEDLKSLIRRVKQIPERTAISIAKEVCEGLSEAHRLGVVHRDLKSSNIMINKEGNARIMDFGIARSLRAKGLTGEGIIIGTPEYMSPEQAEAKEVDNRSDIYSLGVILYEMVTGELPFEGDTPLSIAMKHKNEIPKNPKELNPQISEDLGSIILKCLEKEKENRYQSAGDVRNELENIEHGLPRTERDEPKTKPLTSREITVQFNLKKIFFPAVAVIALIAVGLIIWNPWEQNEPVSILSEKPSIAVLPFDDLSPQEDQQYFCDGIARSIIMALSRVENLQVLAPTSSFSLRDKQVEEIKEIVEKLKVNTILSGSLQKSGNKVRIIVELMNIDDDSLLWAEQYDRELDDILLVQDRITLKIIERLKVNLLGEETSGLTKRFTNNIEAYDLYQKGQYFLGRRNERDIRDSINYFEEAIELDPNFALAYSRLAFSLSLLPLYSNVHIDEVRHKVTEACQEALDLDPMIPEAYNALGVLYRITWEWDKAEIEFKNAIELNPNYADAYHMYSFYLLQLARLDEAIENIKMALKLDPLSLIINQNLGELYYYARKYDRSIEATKRTIEMDPAFPQAHYFLGMAYLANGMYEKAMEEFQLEKNLPIPWNSYYVDSVIGVNYAKQGMMKEAEKILSKLKGESLQTYVPPRSLAYLCFALGKNDEGLDFLETGYAIKNAAIAYLKVDPLFDCVRTDPRFIKLLERIGLD